MNFDAVRDLRSASADSLVHLIHRTPPQALLPVLDNPALDENILALVLQRRDLPGEFLDEVFRRRQLSKAYQIKKLLAFHPHTPRVHSLRLLRELYLMDLVQFTISPGVLPDLKIKAEDQVISKLPQLPLGQKIMLARRSTARIAGALLAEGQPQVVKAALSNPKLSESQVLRVLAKEKLPPILVQAIAQSTRWSQVYNVRIALVRQPATTLTTILAFLPELTISDLRELVAPGILPENLRHYLQAEIQSRLRRPSTATSGGKNSAPKPDEPDRSR